MFFKATSLSESESKLARCVLVQKQNFHFEKNVLRRLMFDDARSCFQELREKFLGVAVVEANFLKTLNYVTKLFREIGCIKRKSGSKY